VANLLLISRDPAQAAALVDALTPAGHTLVCVPDTEAALTILRARPIELVFVDERVTPAGAAEACAALRGGLDDAC
jgi:DNA-binding response OmpR family regulator